MNLNKERQGELHILISVLMWSVFPVITILSYNSISPLVSLLGSTFFAAVFFAIVLSLKKKWYEVKNTPVLKEILLATLFNGILYYILTFIGLRYTSAGNASIIVLTEVFFSYLLFHVFKRDHLPVYHKKGRF